MLPANARYRSAEDRHLAEFAAGILIQGLGRASDGAFTRAVFEPPERRDTWLQSFGRGFLDTVTLNFLDELEAVWLDATSGRTMTESLAATRNNQDLYEASNPNAYRGGQLTGMGLQSALGILVPYWLAPGLSNFDRMALGLSSGTILGALDGAGQATDWRNAIERALVGAAYGGIPGKYIPLFNPAVEFGTGFAHNVVGDAIEQYLWPDGHW